MKKIFTLLILLVIIVVSCSTPPPDDSELVLFRNEIWTAIEEYNSIDRTDINALKALDEDRKQDELKRVIYLQEGEQYTISSSDYIDSIMAGDIGISIPGNRGIATSNGYISYLDKDTMIYSEDRQKWYQFGTDLDKDMMNIVTIMNFIYDYNQDELTNHINWSQRIYLNKSNQLIEIDENLNREIYQLKKGLILTDAYLQGFRMKNNEENVDVDLEKSILAIKEGTVLTMDLNIEGNLIRGRTVDGVIIIDILQDVYFYTSDTKIGFSFDNLDWKHSLFSFEIDANMLVEAVSDNEVLAKVNVSLDYEE